MEPRKCHKSINGFPLMYFVLNYFRLLEFFAREKEKENTASCSRENKKCTFSRDLDLTPELDLF